MTAFILILLLQIDVTGEWAVTLDAAMGERRYTMLLRQKGERLAGDMLSETGQFEISGSIKGDQVAFEWTFPDRGRLVKLTFAGKVSGDSMSGWATAANLGDAPMYAQRR